ncbi:MAG: SCP2 sterol-binding domain-containing protein, partial [Bacteroidota bacterium]
IIAKMVIDDVSYDEASSDLPKPSTTKAHPITNGHQAEKPKADISFGDLQKGMQEKAGAAAPLGHTLKFNFGEEQLVIDGTGDQNAVHQGDLPAECTVNVSVEDFQGLVSGKLNPMNAVMSGKVRIEGDMGVAMKLQSLFG